MQINLYHNRECGSYLQAIQALEEALIDTNIPPLFIIQLVQNDEDAQKYKFFGSPTIKIDGKDIDSDADKTAAYHVSGCRMYVWKDKTHDHPPKEMIMGALARFRGSSLPE